MAYLLDTNAISEVLKRDPERKVIDWLSDTEESLQFLSAFSIGELQKGISRIPDSRRKDELQDWFDQLQTRYGSRILPFTIEAAKNWGRMLVALEKIGRPLPVVDSLIAATAEAHALTVVTRNADDFAAAGVSVLNIWE